MLRATIQRAARTEAVLSQTGLAKIIGKMNRLPSLPSVYIEILDALRDPDRDLTDIGRIVGRDIAMTAQILKLVNSAFFGLRREISNPTEAVHFIGVETLKHLVLSAHLFTEFQKARASGFCLNNLSDHSLSTAKGSHIITRIEQSDCSISEEAFCAGMLHDTGKLVLAHNFPTQYSHILQDSHTRHLPLHTLEKERLGADHAEIGGYLLGLWGLPVRVVEAITLHHNPSVGSFEKMSPLLAVCSANFLVQNLHHNPPPPPPPPLEDLLSQQGFSEHWNLWHQSLQDQIASA
jgi:HD-like signal output (HDOD) protein